MWCILENKVPTWDNLQKRNVYGPGWCCLCKNAVESTTHLFLQCRFVAEVWKECSKMSSIQYRWNGVEMEQAWKLWVSNPANKGVIPLPLIVMWGIWLARNSSIFKDKEVSSESVAVKSINILAAYPQKSSIPKTKNLSIVEIDKSRPWGFFDGASQNNLCGGGALLFLSEDHFFKIAIGLGDGTNNYAEILSLKMLLVFAIEHSVKDLSIYGDSMNVINWTKGTQRCLNLNLENLMDEVLMLLSYFESFSCHHIYRSQNQEADKKSKEGLLLNKGQWKITEFQG